MVLLSNPLRSRNATSRASACCCPRRKSSGFLVPAILLLLGPLASDADVSEYALKSAFIYNFAKFIEWTRPADGTLHLCVLADEAFEGEFDKLNGKAVGTLRLKVDHPSRTDAADTCNIFFIAESESENLPRIIRMSKDLGALTVSDSKGFLDRGVMIEMQMEDGRVSFEVNMAAARAAALTIGAKLLRLAKRVYW